MCLEIKLKGNIKIRNFVNLSKYIIKRELDLNLHFPYLTE